MNNQVLLNKINSFFSTDLEKSMANVMIMQNDDGTYELFNKYIISIENSDVVVKSKHTHTIKKFSSLPVAVTWCIFDKRNKITELNRVEYLDQMLSGLSYSITLHKKLFKNNKDTTFISLAKLSQDVYKKKLLNNELMEYIAESKIWQLKQFSKN